MISLNHDYNGMQKILMLYSTMYKDDTYKKNNLLEGKERSSNIIPQL